MLSVVNSVVYMIFLFPRVGNGVRVRRIWVLRSLGGLLLGLFAMFFASFYWFVQLFLGGVFRFSRALLWFLWVFFVFVWFFRFFFLGFTVYRGFLGNASVFYLRSVSRVRSSLYLVGLSFVGNRLIRVDKCFSIGVVRGAICEDGYLYGEYGLQVVLYCVERFLWYLSSDLSNTFLTFVTYRVVCGLRKIGSRFYVTRFSMPNFRFLVLSQLRVYFLSFFSLGLRGDRLAVPLLLVRVRKAGFYFTFTMFFMYRECFLLYEGSFFFSVYVRSYGLLVLVRG